MNVLHFYFRFDTIVYGEWRGVTFNFPTITLPHHPLWVTPTNSS
jgi:hypothetical protein